jgi:hypothetical protein
MPSRVITTVLTFLAFGSASYAAVIGIDARSRGGNADNLWTGEALDTFRSRISALGHTTVQVTSFRSAQLDGLDALILVNPFRASERWSNAEIADIRSAVVHRMNLVIIGEIASNVGVGGDRTESDVVLDQLNALAGTYGVQYARFTDNGRMVGGFIQHALTSGLNACCNPGITVHNYRKLIQMQPPSLNLTTGSEESDNVLAVVNTTPCGGGVAFLADLSTWWDADYLLNVGLGEQNNSRLLDNVINFAAQLPATFDDCNENDLPDHCDIAAGRSLDCNSTSIPDECDLLEGTSDDFNQNGVPDECDPDCQPNGFPDFLDIALGQSDDCNLNSVPDDCEPGDFDLDDVLDICDEDIDDDGVPNPDDQCDFSSLGSAVDASGRTYGDVDQSCSTDLLDWGVLVQGMGGPSMDRSVTWVSYQTGMQVVATARGFPDCNENGVPDIDDIREGASNDFNDNGVPDECDPDCQGNGIPDFIEISVGASEDCNDDEVPDECQADDFDNDGTIDVCDEDSDDDGVDDTVDLCRFTPLQSPVDADGRPLGDINDDCDVDLRDCLLFQRGFSGETQDH